MFTKMLNFAVGVYDNWANHDLREIHKKLIKLADLRPNEKILDLACGTGNLDIHITKLSGECSIYGLDIGSRMLEIARKRAKWEKFAIDYLLGSSTDLPYRDNEFDVVFTCLIYHHLNYEERCRTFQEISRVLKPNGKYVSLEFQELPKDVFHRIFLRLSTGNSEYKYVYPAELIENNGFYIKKALKGRSLIGKPHPTYYRILMKNETI
jgi:ubiquinone/menaquinone biosynthesis C-methylase UbiE